jgi:hypothetical protein
MTAFGDILAAYPKTDKSTTEKKVKKLFNKRTNNNKEIKDDECKILALKLFDSCGKNKWVK